MPVSEMLRWLESMRIAVWIRESLWGFPIAVGTHILGLSISVGLLAWFDLRLLGLGMNRAPVSTLYRQLMPWTLCGFSIMFLSGACLFAAYATLAYENLYFRIKMAALLLAAVNAIVYHSVATRHIAAWDSHSVPPLPARMAGLISLGLWITVIVAGRMMSYTMF